MDIWAVFFGCPRQVRLFRYAKAKLCKCKSQVLQMQKSGFVNANVTSRNHFFRNKRANAKFCKCKSCVFANAKVIFPFFKCKS